MCLISSRNQLGLVNTPYCAGPALGCSGFSAGMLILKNFSDFFEDTLPFLVG